MIVPCSFAYYISVVYPKISDFFVLIDLSTWGHLCCHRKFKTVIPPTVKLIISIWLKDMDNANHFG